MNIQNCSIYNEFNDNVIVVKAYWSYSLQKKDYNTKRGRQIIGTNYTECQTENYVFILNYNNMKIGLIFKNKHIEIFYL